MKAFAEADDSGPTGVLAGYLDGVLHRLGTAVDQHGTSVVSVRKKFDQLLAKLQVRFVGGHVDARVLQQTGLFRDRLHHFRVAVSHRGDADTGGQVQKFSTLHIGENGPFAVGHYQSIQAAHARAHAGLSAFQNVSNQGTIPRALDSHKWSPASLPSSYRGPIGRVRGRYHSLSHRPRALE